MQEPPAQYQHHVFLNCPFDDDYQSIMEAIVFCIRDCGFIVRCALERSDSGEIRLERILTMIGECRFGIHDLSRVELDDSSQLPRFNMPLELGLFRGAKEFRPDLYGDKLALVLDSERYRYQASCSDLAGSDIGAHHDNPEVAIAVVRKFLHPWRKKGSALLSAGKIVVRYRLFMDYLPLYAEASGATEDELRGNFLDLNNVMDEWFDMNPC